MNSYLELTSRIEENGFVDLVFSIAESTVSAETMTFTAKARHDNHILGFNLTVPVHYPAGIAGRAVPKNGVIRNGAVFRTIGSESDNFARTLGELYGLKPPPSFARQGPSFTMIPLIQTPVDGSQQRVHTKLFFDDADQRGLYSECYLNIDINNQYVELFEKDPEYRPHLLRAFSE